MVTAKNNNVRTRTLKVKIIVGTIIRIIKPPPGVNVTTTF